MSIRTKNWVMVIFSLSLNLVFFTRCTTSRNNVPDKLPELLIKTSEEIDNQSAVIFNKLKRSIMANQATLETLELIRPIIADLDESKFSAAQLTTIDNFKKAYSNATKLAKNILSQKAEIGIYQQNLSTLTNSIRFSVGCLKQDDPNQQIEAIMELINFSTTR